MLRYKHKPHLLHAVKQQLGSPTGAKTDLEWRSAEIQSKCTMELFKYRRAGSSISGTVAMILLATSIQQRALELDLRSRDARDEK